MHIYSLTRSAWCLSLGSLVRLCKQFMERLLLALALRGKRQRRHETPATRQRGILKMRRELFSQLSPEAERADLVMPPPAGGTELGDRRQYIAAPRQEKDRGLAHQRGSVEMRLDLRKRQAFAFDLDELAGPAGEQEAAAVKAGDEIVHRLPRAAGGVGAPHLQHAAGPAPGLGAGQGAERRRFRLLPAKGDGAGLGAAEYLGRQRAKEPRRMPRRSKGQRPAGGEDDRHLRRFWQRVERGDTRQMRRACHQRGTARRRRQQLLPDLENAGIERPSLAKRQEAFEIEAENMLVADGAKGCRAAKAIAEAAVEDDQL